jgi:hypothetical protein
VFDVSVANIFSPVASRIVRTLLLEPKRQWSILALSRETGAGYGHSHRVVKTLLKMGLCRKTDAHRILLTNPGELLTRWANYFDFASSSKLNAYYSLNDDLDKFLRKLAAARRRTWRHALTLQAGAALVSPYVRPANIHLYVNSQQLQQWREFLNLELTEMGGNVFLVEPYDEGVFFQIQKCRGLPVVSNIQLYVDLYNYPARGREAAEHLRKEVIGF